MQECAPGDKGGAAIGFAKMRFANFLPKHCNKIMVIDQVLMPMAPDCEATVVETHYDKTELGLEVFSLSWDFGEAHRIPRLAEEDWGMTRHKLEEKEQEALQRLEKQPASYI